MIQNLRTLLVIAIVTAAALWPAPLRAQSSKSSTGEAAVPIEKPIESTGPLPHQRRSTLQLGDFAKSAQDLQIQNGVLNPDDLTKLTLPDLKIKTPDLKHLDLKSILGDKGAVDGGGGDELGLEFQAAAMAAIREMKLYEFRQFDNEDWQVVGDWINAVKIMARDEATFSKFKASETHPTLITFNNLSTKTVFVNRAKWKAITDQRIKNVVALNAVLEMKRGKEAGAEVEATMSLQAIGYDNSVLVGQAARLDRSQAQTPQCLWAIKRLKEEVSWYGGELLMCRETKAPGLLKIKEDLIERLALRALENCIAPDTIGIQTLAKSQYQEFTRFKVMARQISPKCAGAR